MDYKILPGHLYSQNKRINLYYLHNLFKEFSAHISLQMKETHNLDTPISAGMWGGSYMVAQDDGQGHPATPPSQCHSRHPPGHVPALHGERPCFSRWLSSAKSRPLMPFHVASRHRFETMHFLTPFFVMSTSRNFTIGTKLLALSTLCWLVCRVSSFGQGFPQPDDWPWWRGPDHSLCRIWRRIPGTSLQDT